MGRYNWIICLLVIAFLVAAFGAVGISEASQEEIITRLRYDLNEVRERNRRLEQQVEQLQAENQELEQKIAELESEPAPGEPVSRIETPEAASPETEQPVEEKTQPEPPREDLPEAVRKIEETVRKLDSGAPPLNWEYGPERAYPILAEPLEQELKKIIAREDSLSRLAHQFYRDAAYWRHLYRYNSELITDVERLPGGREIELPPLSYLKYMQD